MDARSANEQLDRCLVLDVREHEEWEAGRIEGAVHVPLAELPLRIDGIDGDRPIVVVCRVGARSEYAASWLAAQGYEAHNLDGGLEAWAAAGLPLTTPDGRPGILA